jgi:DNA-binding transcriptional LysR family regulator
MELRHLRYFIAVAEELHFSRAAARLHIAQPPLSQQIKQLEAELHTQLLWRTKRRVELTAAGEAFLEEARKTLAQADHAARVAQWIAAGETGQVQLGFIDSALPGYLPRLLRAFRERHPDVQVVLHELTSGQQIEALKRAEIQLAVLRPTRAGPQVAFHEIGSEGLLVAMPAEHRLAELETVPVGELEHEGWVLFPRLLSPGLHDYLVGICRKAGFVPRVVQEAHEGPTIVGLVGAGVGIALVAESMTHLGGPEVVYRPLRASVARLPMCVAWRRDERARVVLSFVDIAKQCGGNKFPPQPPSAK